MKNLNEDLKTGKLKQAYLLYGEENYLKRQYKERITKALLGEDDTMNYAYYEGKEDKVKRGDRPCGDTSVLRGTQIDRI